MEIVFFWIMLSIAVGILAARYERSAIGWVLFALILSPVLGFAFLLAVGPRVRAAAAMVVAPPPASAQRMRYTPPTEEQGGGRLAIFVAVVAVIVVLIFASRSSDRPSAVAKPPPTKPTVASARIETGSTKPTAEQKNEVKARSTKWDGVKEAAEIAHRCNEERKKPAANQRASVIAKCPQ